MAENQFYKIENIKDVDIRAHLSSSLEKSFFHSTWLRSKGTGHICHSR